MNTTSLTLLACAQRGDDANAWQRLVSIYQPILTSWLRRQGVQSHDADDLVQEVLAVVVKELPLYEHRQAGSFRGWLRAILGHRLRTYWRQGRCRPQSNTDTLLLDTAEASSDENHELTRAWNQEHDRQVLARLLELLEDEFEPGTLRAFQLVVLEEQKAEEAAQALNVSIASIYIAKSRVLRRLRTEAAGLIDEYS